jgi:hypothetical protein
MPSVKKIKGVYAIVLTPIEAAVVLDTVGTVTGSKHNSFRKISDKIYNKLIFQMQRNDDMNLWKEVNGTQKDNTHTIDYKNNTLPSKHDNEDE